MQDIKQIRSKTRNLYGLVAIIAIAIVAGAFAYGKFNFLPNWMKTSFRLGLDLSGGTNLVYQVDTSQIPEADRSAVVSGLRDVIEKRVNLFGVSEPRVETAEVNGSHRLIVELAGVKDIKDAIQLIGETPFLEFKEQRTQEETNLILEKQKANDAAYLSVDPYFTPAVPALTGQYLKSAQLVFDKTTYEPYVGLQFNDEGAAIFEELTGKNINKILAIYLDGQPISLPTVGGTISGGEAQITGSFTTDEAKLLVERLNAGALPAPITLVSQQSIGASLGEHSFNVSIKAGVIGLALVIVFMLVYYRVFGLFASLALLIYTALSLAIFKLIPVTLTLSGIAGFILSIGMAVDANILIFERTKEERRRGLDKFHAIEEGFKRAWPSIRDSNISTIITCLVLYNFTTSIVKGFALTLLIGVVVSMFTAITVTRSFLRVFMTKES
ncbi:MAG TPA: protein translocase subunit SecD [Candidatus Paceibacterota bacterium]|nr:protein translocase subunit SecD [Candidatus Paceibacterota bacterium]HPT40430.1 protein translocase subunit SecD [Candidatus Paceibacterota bacterium]